MAHDPADVGEDGEPQPLGPGLSVLGVEGGGFDVVLSDLRLPDITGIEVEVAAARVFGGGTNLEAVAGVGLGRFACITQA